MSESLGADGVAKAMAACTNCHRPGRRILLAGGLWICPGCDHGWAILDHAKHRGRPL